MEQRIRFFVLIVLVTVICSGSVWSADLTLGRLFSDGAVLQQGVEIPVWGWGDPGQYVTLNFNGFSQTAEIGESGDWRIMVPPMGIGGPYQLVVHDEKNRIVVNNILVGEVWICSGQSNMEWQVGNSANAEFEANTAHWPEIRHFNVPNRVSNRPLDRLSDGQWKIATPENVAEFTAVGYFFARELYKHNQTPIGLINSTWGGTIVETWISPEAIRTIDAYRAVVDELQALDMAAIEAQRKQKIEEMLGEPLAEEDQGMMGEEAIWAGVDWNRSSWKQMELPSLWENRGLEGLDGIVWFSKEFELTEEQAAQGILLSLGPIDDTDITWINGQNIGGMNRYNEPRQYEVAPGILKAGKNLLVVRVTDTGGGGGIYGNPEQMYIESDGEKVPLAGLWQYKVGAAQIQSSIEPNSKPTLLYNGMIHPLIPYAFRGAIWYQGESNAGQAYQYRDNFPLLIQDWREKWGIGDFPFLFVQLANFMQPAKEPGESAWAELRESQSMTLALPNTGQAVIIDIGEADDIHPRNKQDVGYRLSLAARRVAYRENLVSSGPLYESMKIVDDKVQIKFAETGSGLVARGTAGMVQGFALAGPDRKFYPATAMIISENEVVVYTKRVVNPVAVRYGWADNPHNLNLYNREGLPACPFRTDDWPGTTEGQFRVFP